MFSKMLKCSLSLLRGCDSHAPDRVCLLGEDAGDPGVSRGSPLPVLRIFERFPKTASWWQSARHCLSKMLHRQLSCCKRILALAESHSIPPPTSLLHHLKGRMLDHPHKGGRRRLGGVVQSLHTQSTHGAYPPLEDST